MTDYAYSNIAQAKSKKRFDLTVKVMPLFGKNWSFPLRLLSNRPYQPNKIKRMARMVAERKEDWKERENYPESYTLTLQEYGVTAIINPEAKEVKPLEVPSLSPSDGTPEPKTNVAPKPIPKPKPTIEPIDPINQPLKD